MKTARKAAPTFETFGGHFNLVMCRFLAILGHWRHKNVNVVKLQTLCEGCLFGLTQSREKKKKKSHLRLENIRINLGGAFLENDDANIVSNVALLMQLLALIFLGRRIWQERRDVKHNLQNNLFNRARGRVA